MFHILAFKNSRDLVQRIEAMEKHFKCKDHIHWYNKAEIVEKCVLPLPFDNLYADQNLKEDWPQIFDELDSKTTKTLACIALAMHNIIVNELSAENQAEFQQMKIYTR